MRFFPFCFKFAKLSGMTFSPFSSKLFTTGKPQKRALVGRAPEQKVPTHHGGSAESVKKKKKNPSKMPTSPSL